MVMLVLIICCAVLAVWSWLRPRGPSPPMYPGALPIIGHTHLYVGEPKHFWNLEKKIFDFSSNNGGIAETRIALKSTYVITDLEDSLVVANTFLDKDLIYNFMKAMYNRGLITAESSIWKPHRKLLAPAFNQQVLNTFVTEHNAQARILVSQLFCEAGKAPFDIQPYLINNVLETVFRTTLGQSAPEEIMKYSRATESLFALYMDRFQRIWLHLPFIFNLSSLKKKHDELMNVIQNITRKIINERRSELKLNKCSDSNDASTQARFKPLIDHLLELADKQNAFTDDEIREHLDTTVSAAYDTTAKALTYTLILVGSHQDVQTKLYEELQEVFGPDQDRDVDRHDLPKLVYLEAVIKESLRFLAPVPRIVRNCQAPVKLKNYTLPAGCIGVLPLCHMNRHTIWGADAEQFKPERWLDPAQLPNNPNAFASFGLGKRNCIGKQYAIMTMKTYLANILRRYRVAGDVSKLETRCDLLLTPVNGHHISLKLRS